MRKLSDAEIEALYTFIAGHHERFLKAGGVTLPRLRRRDGRFTKDALTLVYLAQGYPQTRWVTKAELTEFIRQYYPETPDVQAGRHLGMQRGFYIVSSRRGNALIGEETPPPNAYKLISLERPHPGFLPGRRALGKIDFERIKETYGYRCVTCGSKEGEENWRYPGVITRLQKGHKNPRKPLMGQNIIPQCDACNRADRGLWVYDRRGRVTGITAARVVIQSIQRGYLPPEEQRRIYEFLQTYLGGRASHEGKDNLD